MCSGVQFQDLVGVRDASLTPGSDTRNGKWTEYQGPGSDWDLFYYCNLHTIDSRLLAISSDVKSPVQHVNTVIFS